MSNKAYDFFFGNWKRTVVTCIVGGFLMAVPQIISDCRSRKAHPGYNPSPTGATLDMKAYNESLMKAVFSEGDFVDYDSLDEKITKDIGKFYKGTNPLLIEVKPKGGGFCVELYEDLNRNNTVDKSDHFFMGNFFMRLYIDEDTPKKVGI